MTAASMDLLNAGLPESFSTTKRVSKNQKKRDQKKRAKNSIPKLQASSQEDALENYAEEFKISETLREMRNPFTILMSKPDRYKPDSEPESEAEGAEEGVSGQEAVSSLKADALVPSESQLNLHKYYQQRYRLFSRFDEGIQIDEEGWYSVTPELIAKHIAEQAFSIAKTFPSARKDRSDDELVVVDAFCGVGGNTIQFAHLFRKVIAIDLDSGRLEMTRNNAKVYGVEDRITFIHGDVFEELPKLKKTMTIDLIFLSPPWGGPGYTQTTEFDPHQHILDGRGLELFNVVQTHCNNSILFLPRQSNIYRLAQMAAEKIKAADDSSFVVEQHWLNDKLKAISVYFYGTH